MTLLGPNPRAEAQARFRDWLARVDGPPLILGHFDADGLSAVAILARALEREGRHPEIRLVGKGENPWDAELRAELAMRAPAGLI